MDCASSMRYRSGIARSASRPGTPLDNAVAESFFKTLKRGIGGKEELWDEGQGQAGHSQVHRALLQ